MVGNSGTRGAENGKKDSSKKAEGGTPLRSRKARLKLLKKTGKEQKDCPPKQKETISRKKIAVETKGTKGGWLQTVH